jgi:hypothetical protein
MASDGYWVVVVDVRHRFPSDTVNTPETYQQLINDIRGANDPQTEVLRVEAQWVTEEYPNG